MSCSMTLRTPMLRRILRSALVLVIGLAVALPASGQSVLGQYFGKNRIQYRDFDWQIYHSPHFDVYYYKAEDESLQKAVSFAESAYDELSRRFDFQIQEPTPLIIYQTHSAFLQQNIIVYGVPEGAQAFASPVRFRMVLPLDLPDAELLALIKHELTHIFQYHILFRGRLGGLRGAPPQWFMEGGASYFANDETAADRKYMIDAVVNDRIPSVLAQGGGFMAYRFGHAVFDFIEERWGQEAVVDLWYEVRNTIGSRMGRAIERTFRMDAEDFDTEFRRWARQKYLPELLASGEPGDFGRPFRLEPGKFGWEMSPAASPSGDLIAAVTTDRQEADISLFDTKKRRRIKVLTKGLDVLFDNIVAQSATVGRGVGRDLSFSPDGNYLAAFARREEGYAMILIDVLNGGIDRVITMDVEQQLAPAWSPDGRYVAFSGNRDGWFDIFLLDLETNEISNVTKDEIFDAGPTFSPDGRFLTYSSVIGEYHQLFRLDLDDPSKRYQLTEGEHNSKEPVYSADGRRIYFTSDRDGGEVDNIFGLDLENKEIRQYTNAVTGCDQPSVLPLPEGGERLVYTGYWKGKFSLYTTDVEEPLDDPEPVELAEAPVELADVPRFEPDIEVTIDEDNIEGYGGKKFFIENIQQFIGLNTNNVFVGRVVVTLSDYLGDRRAIGLIDAVDTLSNFDVRYLNLKNRWQWSGRLFNQRFQVFVPDFQDGRFERRTAFKMTGLEYTRMYPFSKNNRVEFTGGFFFRDLRFGGNTLDFASGEIVTVFEPRKDEYPSLGAAFVSDTAIYAPFGALNGHLFRIGAEWAPDLEDSGTLFTNVSADIRQYVAVGRRANLAFRFAGSFSSGNLPTPTYVGGLDTIRGFEFRELAGFRSFYGNAEFRFPLIDQLRFPGFALSGIRGVVFFDIGTAWFPSVTDFEIWDSDEEVLQDVVASAGFGVTLNLFGFALNWDFAQVLRSELLENINRFTFEERSTSSFETSFWIGRRF